MEDEWSVDKKAWCCKNRKIGCSLHDCHVGFQNRETWPPQKRRWCCWHEGVGCPEITHLEHVSLSYDCLEGELGDWSAGKKEYCCQHQHIGCTATVRSTMSTTASVHFACKTWSFDKWSDTEKDWCC